MLLILFIDHSEPFLMLSVESLITGDPRHVLNPAPIAAEKKPTMSRFLRHRALVTLMVWGQMRRDHLFVKVELEIAGMVLPMVRLRNIRTFQCCSWLVPLKTQLVGTIGPRRANVVFNRVLTLILREMTKS